MTIPANEIASVFENASSCGRNSDALISAGADHAPCSVTRRPERADDEAFRLALFRASRSPAENLDGLDPSLAGLLYGHQFAGQNASYRTAYPRGRFELIECGGALAGRIVTDLSTTALTLVDLALVPEHRGRGFGTNLLRSLQHDARAAGVPLRLSVLGSNVAARRLYERLGFARVGATDTHIDMEWTP